MYINSIAHAVPVTILFENGTEIEATFDGNIDHVRFNVISPELFKIAEESVGEKLTGKLPHEGTYYSFSMEIVKKGNNQNNIECKMTGPFKEISRSEDFCLDVAFKVRVRTYAPLEKSLSLGKSLFEGLSNNISKTGMRLFGDYPIEDPLKTYFTLEISFVPHGSQYYIPARMVHNQPNTVTRSYRYDYGFAFDFTNHRREEEKLLTEILELKLRGVF